MFFRVLFYVGKVAGVLFVLFIGSTFVRRWVPEMDLLTRAILAILIPKCIAGACLGVAVFVFGMRMRCPFYRRLGKVGGGRHYLLLGTVYGHMIRDFTLRVEPHETGVEK